MKSVKYSPDAVEKLRLLREELTIQYGILVARTIIRKIRKSIQGLSRFGKQGMSIEELLGISCDYYLLYVQYNYVIYRITEDNIWIIGIYNEKEDYIWKLFGIKTVIYGEKEY